MIVTVEAAVSVKVLAARRDWGRLYTDDDRVVHLVERLLVPLSVYSLRRRVVRGVWGDQSVRETVGGGTGGGVCVLRRGHTRGVLARVSSGRRRDGTRRRGDRGDDGTLDHHRRGGGADGLARGGRRAAERAAAAAAAVGGGGDEESKLGDGNGDGCGGGSGESSSR